MSMTSSQQQLWLKIEQFPMDDPVATFRFSDRLARENGWTSAKTARVIQEYRKFLFLACAAGHPVTPSMDVDEVWHLHMIYTDHYWNALCNETLGRPLHHGPTKGSGESAKFHEWYQNTLESYKRFFDCDPPAEIWPCTEMRFDRRNITLRVNQRTHWVVPKPLPFIVGKMAACHFKWPVKNVRPMLVMSMVSIALLLLAGCSRVFRDQPLSSFQMANPVFAFDWVQFMIAYPIFCIILFVLVLVSQKRLLDSPLDASAENYKTESPEMIALMQQHAYQRHGLAELIVARLLTANVIAFNKNKGSFECREIGLKLDNPFDQEVFRIIAKETGTSTITMEYIEKELAKSDGVQQNEFLIKERKLFELKHLLTAQVFGLLVHLIVLGVGIYRFAIDFPKSDPIEVLLLELVAFCLFGFMLYAKPLLIIRFSKGAKILRVLEKSTAYLWQDLNRLPAPDDTDYWRNFAIFGTKVLPNSDLFEVFAQESVGCGGCG